MSRSGFGELLLYKHSLSNDSETSLWEAEQHNQDPVKDMATRVTLVFSFEYWMLVCHRQCLFTLLLSGPAPLPKPFL